MSAFVGPIHRVMYERILLQDQMSRLILEQLDDTVFADQIWDAYPEAAKAKFDDVVDPTDIHGWLSEKVAVAETRFAKVATKLQKDKPEAIPAVKAALRNLGESTPLALNEEINTAYRGFSYCLLDGMPCDFPFVFEEPTDDRMSWSIKSCPHAPFWEPEKADFYYDLRESFCAGLLEKTAYSYSQDGERFYFYRKENV